MCPIHHIGRSPKRMGERLRFVTFRVKCFLWTEKDGGGPFAGFGFASDVSETGAGVYLDVPLTKGAPVRIAFEDEGATAFRGMVVWCRRYSLDHRFHGQTNLEYRVGVQLLFDSEVERQRYLMEFNDLRKRAASMPNQFKF